MFYHRISNLTKLIQEFHRATIKKPMESEEYKKMSREMPVVFASLLLLFLFSLSRSITRYSDCDLLSDNSPEAYGFFH